MPRLAAALLLLAPPLLPQTANPDQLFREAVAAQQRGDDALAVRKYRELLKLYPDVLEVRANLGAALARMGKLDEAIEQYRAALSKAPSNDALRLNLALAHYKKGEHAAAADHLALLHRAAPADLRTTLLLADCYFRLQRDAEVIRLLMPAESANTNEPTLAWLLGSALIRIGRPRDGLERVEKAARLGKKAEAYLLAGQTALALNEFERARDHAQAAAGLDPRLAGAHTLLGTTLQYLGDNPGAIAALRKAVVAKPDDFDAQLTLGAVLYTERDMDAARRHLDRALQLRPASPAALYQIARLQRTEGNLNEAAANLEKVVRAEPGWAQPHLELATVYFRLKRQQDGERERATYQRLNAEQERQERAAQQRATAPLSR